MELELDDSHAVYCFKTIYIISCIADMNTKSIVTKLPNSNSASEKRERKGIQEFIYFLQRFHRWHKIHKIYSLWWEARFRHYEFIDFNSGDKEKHDGIFNDVINLLHTWHQHRTDPLKNGNKASLHLNIFLNVYVNGVAYYSKILLPLYNKHFLVLTL